MILFFKDEKLITSIQWKYIIRFWRQEDREFQYLAIDYLKNHQELLGELTKIIGRLVLKYSKLKDDILVFSVDDNIWIRRVAIMHQLGFKEKTDQELMMNIIINNLGRKEFLINKAIGVALRNYSKVNPQWVESFIDMCGDEMSRTSRKKASKYILKGRG